MPSNRRYAIHAARYWYRYSCDLTHFNVWASFLLIMRPEHLCKGKPSVTAGRKAKGSQHTRDGRAARVHGAPQPESIFAPFTSGSRAHDVGRAITPQGKL